MIAAHNDGDGQCRTTDAKCLSHLRAYVSHDPGCFILRLCATP
jgi:hypothetical protein